MLQSSQPFVVQDFTIEPYFIYFLLDSEFPVSVPVLTIVMAQESAAQAQTMGSSLGTFYIIPRKTHL
jgi:hypothetical protein